jgi:hypothetical protein
MTPWLSNPNDIDAIASAGVEAELVDLPDLEGVVPKDALSVVADRQPDSPDPDVAQVPITQETRLHLILVRAIRSWHAMAWPYPLSYAASNSRDSALSM